LRAVNQAQEKPERVSIVERIRNMNKFVKYSAAASVAIVATVAAIVISRGGELPSTDEGDTASVAAFNVPFSQYVREQGAIVVAVPLDHAPAKPNDADAPAGLPDEFIRWKVVRILKGQLAAQTITTKYTSSYFEGMVGKEWIVMLSPDYVAGKCPYLSWICPIDREPEILAILGKAPVRVEPGQKARTSVKVSPSQDKKPQSTALPAVKR
jgi:hypothetical protein